MYEITLVSTDDELAKIRELNQANLKTTLGPEEQNEQGFLTWSYSRGLLRQMHALAPSVIAKYQDRVVGYALTTLKEARVFHPDLAQMFRDLDAVEFDGKPLSYYNFYCMGQICVDKNHRGKGLPHQLYLKHRELYSDRFDFLLTEISTSNLRSIRSHEKTGFQPIHRYRDEKDEWIVVIWDWRK